MKSILFKFVASFLLSFCVGLNVALAMVDRVLVIVNEDIITQSEFDYRLATVMDEFKSGERPLPNNLNKQLLESMIRDRLQVQEANRRGITISDQEVDGAMERFAGQQNSNVAQLKAQLEQTGQPFQLFRESIRDSMTISRFTDYYARTRVIVPDYEIDGFIAQNKWDQDSSEYHLAQILIKEPELNEELAQRVRNEIADGMSFQEAVITYSESTDAQDGGILGWRRAEQLPTLYRDAVKELQVGGVTPVLKSSNGLHILKLLDMKGERTEIIQSNVRHILISADSKVARSQAVKKLYKLRQRVIDGENFESLARIYSDDSVSAANGGSLNWVSPGEMVPEFEQAFEKAGLGEVSLPIETQFGVHILVVEDRRKKNITDQLIRARAENILRRQRAEREFQQWVRELLEGAFVEYVADPVIS